MNSNAVQHVEEAKALTAFLREATENLLNREVFSTDCDLVAHGAYLVFELLQNKLNSICNEGESHE